VFIQEPNAVVKYELLGSPSVLLYVNHIISRMTADISPVFRTTDEKPFMIRYRLNYLPCKNPPTAGRSKERVNL